MSSIKILVIWNTILTIALFVLLYLNCLVLHNEACQDDFLTETSDRVNLLEYNIDHTCKKDTLIIQNQIFLK